jgi:hypothetical protein
MSLAVSSAVAASQTAAAAGRWAAALGCGISAVPSIMPGSSSPVAAHDGIEINFIVSIVAHWSITDVEGHYPIWRQSCHAPLGAPRCTSMTPNVHGSPWPYDAASTGPAQG